MRAKLNKKIVDAAKYQGPGSCFYWDTETAGFGLRVYPSGRKAFVVTYRVRGKQRFYTVGRYGELTIDDARTKAFETLARARKGEDPSGDRLASRRSPTVADLFARYMKEHARVKMKPKSARRDELAWKRHLLPRFGHRKVADIQRADVAQVHAEMASTPVMANRVRSVLSMAFNLAEVWGWRPEGSNPCRHVRRYKEQARERYLSESELRRLGSVLAEAEESWDVSRHAIAAIRLLILTGCRSIEIRTLRWEFVDFERRCLRLPESKTGRKTVQLNAGALEILETLERIDGNPFVIPGKKAGAHLYSLEWLWNRIREAAKLEDVRIHDLRHTYASYAVNAGFTLPVIGKLLGHSKTATTERYAHLAVDPIRQANEKIGATLGATLAGQTDALRGEDDEDEEPMNGVGAIGLVGKGSSEGYPAEGR